ncbi:hypothetical protein ACOSQ4_012632 [Xanthoceras sorbifolium]
MFGISNLIIINMEHKDGVKVFDLSKLQKQPDLPTEFMWPLEDLVNANPEELDEPLIDLEKFARGDDRAKAAELVRKACISHGFFQVINHGVDASLIQAAHEELDAIFKLPFDKKLSIRKPGSLAGYSGGHAHRYASKLPWKETFSFIYHENSSEAIVVDYFKSVLGQDFERKGWVYQKYCEALKKVSRVIFELLALSLGVEDGLHFQKYFEDGSSILRCNYYPQCNNPGQALGTGPHYDPTSLTILHQDQVGGLEVFVDEKWQTVRPRADALVINIGDTFMALSNGNFKSCLHRAVVNSETVRKSFAFFVSPKEDKVVKPPEDLVSRDGSRKYPDFTWSDLLEFTQKHHRADTGTLKSFVEWSLSHPKTSI